MPDAQRLRVTYGPRDTPTRVEQEAIKEPDEDIPIKLPLSQLQEALVDFAVNYAQCAYPPILPPKSPHCSRPSLDMLLKIWAFRATSFVLSIQSKDSKEEVEVPSAPSDGALITSPDVLKSSDSPRQRPTEDNVGDNDATVGDDSYPEWSLVDKTHCGEDMITSTPDPPWYKDILLTVLRAAQIP